MKLVIRLIAFCVMSGTSQIALAAGEWTGNIGVTSNYIWRGVTQSNDDAAIQGGIDYTASSNWYAGIWTSSLGGGNSYELDWYGGFRGKLGNIPFDAGVIYYQYPIQGSGDNFLEIQGKFDFNIFFAQAAFTLNKDNTSQDNDLYLSIGTDFEIRRRLYLNLLFGLYEYDDPAAEDYRHFHIALKKEDFVFALDKNNKDQTIASDPGDMRVSVSWQKNFDL